MIKEEIHRYAGCVSMQWHASVWAYGCLTYVEVESESVWLVNKCFSDTNKCYNLGILI